MDRATAARTLSTSSRAALRAALPARRAAFGSAALAIGVISGGGGLDGQVYGAAAAIGFVVSQLIFAVWLSARHSGR